MGREGGGWVECELGSKASGGGEVKSKTKEGWGDW